MKLDRNLGLKTIFNELQRKAIWIILTTVVCASALWGYSSFRIPPLYQAKGSIYVYSDTIRVEGIVTSAELSASQQLAETCKVIIESDLVLDEVERKLNSARSAAQMRNSITVSSANGTEILNIYVTDTDPKMAKKVANAVLTVIPNEIIRIVKAGDAEVIDYAKTPGAPISPNVGNYTLSGALFGFLFSCGIVVLRCAFFNKIRDEEDIIAYFDEPVLGSIPAIKRRGDSNE